uniref:Uncharacterized protein n=1 Tax=Anopheles coluzzii TaxID=1518534 RepID=A0A8W7PCY2_ANOCL
MSFVVGTGAGGYCLCIADEPRSLRLLPAPFRCSPDVPLPAGSWLLLLLLLLVVVVVIVVVAVLLLLLPPLVVPIAGRGLPGSTSARSFSRDSPSVDGGTVGAGKEDLADCFFLLLLLLLLPELLAVSSSSGRSHSQMSVALVPTSTATGT